MQAGLAEASLQLCSARRIRDALSTTLDFTTVHAASKHDRARHAEHLFAKKRRSKDSPRDGTAAHAGA